MRRWCAFLALTLWMAVAAPCALSAADLQPLRIETKTDAHTFLVELATTREQQDRGLMFRKTLEDSHGMLFDFKREQPVSFWMQNTYISLDIMFIRADGRILRIAENTKPMSTDQIESGGPVKAVLEVNAGTSKKLGIAAGDQVIHPILGSRYRERVLFPSSRRQEPVARVFKNNTDQPPAHPRLGVDVDTVWPHLRLLDRRVAMNDAFSEIHAAGEEVVSDPHQVVGALLFKRNAGADAGVAKEISAKVQ